MNLSNGLLFFLICLLTSKFSLAACPNPAPGVPVPLYLYYTQKNNVGKRMGPLTGDPITSALAYLKKENDANACLPDKFIVAAEIDNNSRNTCNKNVIAFNNIPRPKKCIPPLSSKLKQCSVTETGPGGCQFICSDAVSGMSLEEGGALLENTPGCSPCLGSNSASAIFLMDIYKNDPAHKYKWAINIAQCI